MAKNTSATGILRILRNIYNSCEHSFGRGNQTCEKYHTRLNKVWNECWCKYAVYSCFIIPLDAMITSAKYAVISAKVLGRSVQVTKSDKPHHRQAGQTNGTLCRRIRRRVERPESVVD